LHRDSGVFAIVLAPTRELSKQITAVLDSLLRCAPWLVSGSVIGGEKKKSEKARLRKGLNILVATPGRLADHLDHTEALDVSNVRWLVLDEGDRLMELGFEDDIKKILNKLDNRMKRGGKQPVEGLPVERVNILCSATMKADVQRLGDLSLKEGKHIKPDTTGTKIEVPNSEGSKIKFSAPAQLKQSYAIVPAKLRLVTLIAFLKRTFARKGAVSKVIVFVSCAHSVDFHFEVSTRSTEVVDTEIHKTVADTDVEGEIPKANEKWPLSKSNAARRADIHAVTQNRRQSAPSIDTDKTLEVTTSAPASIVSTSETITAFRLHGSLPQKIRTSTIQAFANSKTPSFLLCTDVASRGLDLPNVDLVVEYDPPFSSDEHLHRIGRTARAGRDGRAIIFLLPGCEEGYVGILKSLRQDEGMSIVGHNADELLRKGLSILSGKTVKEAEAGWQQRATDLQLGIERWVLENPRVLEMARRGYQSHIRAYATHVAAERGMFDIKQLHLGHLAKAFGLRDRPGNINVPGMRASAAKVKVEGVKAGVGGAGKAGVKRGDEVDSGGKENRKRKATDIDLQDQSQRGVDQARVKMRAKMKMLQYVNSGAGEFNLA
jgi:ATP-dependent RNA helicase DDX31/DBP7